LTQNANCQIFDPGYILVRGDRIAAVGPGRPLAGLLADVVIHATSMAVLHGLVNAHAQIDN
jgi:imidazolonepropionase-like amidohydrolase